MRAVRELQRVKNERMVVTNNDITHIVKKMHVLQKHVLT